MANATVKIPFSASIQGEPIKVTANSTPGALIHTTSISNTTFDAIFLKAFNSDTVDRVLTIEYGGPTAPDLNLVMTIPFQSGQVLIIDGDVLVGNGSVGLTIKAFASVVNVVTIWGYVLRTIP